MTVVMYSAFNSDTPTFSKRVWSHNRTLLSIILATLSQTLIQSATAGGFIEDSKATFSLRNFYFNQDNRNGGGPRSEEWGQAFFLDYKSGFTEGTIGFGLDVFAMQGIRLDAGGRAGKMDADRNPGALFPLESNGKAKSNFGRLGITGKLRYSKTEARLGTLLPKMPVLIYNDGRLLPQLFQGAQITSNEIDNLSLTAGKIERSIERNSSNSHGLSIAGANSGNNARFSNEFYFAGADYKPTQDLLLQYYYGNLRDFYKQHFLGLIHNWKLPVGALKSDLRYFYSDSDGKNETASGRAKGYRSAGANGSSGEVDNNLWSAMFTYSLSGHSLGLGYQKVTGNSDWPRINLGTGQTVHLITNLQIGKFASAGEQSFVSQYSYDFARLGIPGLKTSLTYVKGWGIDAAGSDKREWERDFRVDYAVQSGFFKGVGLSWRNATLRGNDTTDRDEQRLILSYSLPLF